MRVLIVPERASDAVAAEVMRLAAQMMGRPLDPDRLQVLRPGDDATRGRRRLTSLNLARSDAGVTARVTLERSGDILTGEEFVADTQLSAAHLVVIEAVLKALEPLLERPAELGDSELVEMGEGRVAYVSLTSAGRTYSGSAIDKRGAADAFARATLQALNRLVGDTPGGVD